MQLLLGEIIILWKKKLFKIPSFCCLEYVNFNTFRDLICPFQSMCKFKISHKNVDFLIRDILCNGSLSYHQNNFFYVVAYRSFECYSIWDMSHKIYFFYYIRSVLLHIFFSIFSFSSCLLYYIIFEFAILYLFSFGVQFQATYEHQSRCRQF